VSIFAPGFPAPPSLPTLLGAVGVAQSHLPAREVQKGIGELPPSAFSAAARIAEGIRNAVDSPNPPLRLALGASSATAMRPALEARIAELDSWQHATEAVDR
ncbi:short-chain dehydrogenase/reductase, partial [Streptomyces amritsarensis]